MTAIPSRLLEIPFSHLRKAFGYKELDEMIAGIKLYPSNEDLAALVEQKSKWVSTVSLIKSELPSLGLKVRERLATHLSLGKGQSMMFVQKRFGEKNQPVSFRKHPGALLSKGSGGRQVDPTSSQKGPNESSVWEAASKRTERPPQQLRSMREALQKGPYRSRSDNSSLFIRSSSMPKATPRLNPQSSIEGSGFPEASNNASTALSGRYDVHISSQLSTNGSFLPPRIKLRTKTPLDL